MSEVKQQPTEVDLDAVSSSGRPNLKSGAYSLRCISAESKKSKANNPMIEYKWEIVSPESVTDKEGKVVKITGLQVMNWIVLTDAGFSRLKGLHNALKLSMKINLVKPDVRQYLGKAVNVALKTTIDTVKDDNTGEVMLDDKGQPITVNNYEIVRFNSPDLEHTIPADSVAF